MPNLLALFAALILHDDFGLNDYGELGHQGASCAPPASPVPTAPPPPPRPLALPAPQSEVRLSSARVSPRASSRKRSSRFPALSPQSTPRGSGGGDEEGGSIARAAVGDGGGLAASRCRWRAGICIIWHTYHIHSNVSHPSLEVRWLTRLNRSPVAAGRRSSARNTRFLSKAHAAH